MEFKKFIKDLNNLDYKILLDVNNFKIYESSDSNDIFKLEGSINKSIDQIIEHLTDSKQLLETHSNFITIQNFSPNSRYMKIKLESEFIEYPYIDRVEEWKIVKDVQETFLYSYMKPIPIHIKKNQENDFTIYLEKGVIFSIFKAKENNETDLKIFISDLEINPLMKPALLKSFLKIYSEFK